MCNFISFLTPLHYSISISTVDVDLNPDLLHNGAVKPKDYSSNLSEKNKILAHLLYTAQAKTIFRGWHCTWIRLQIGFKDGGQVIIPV